MASSLERSSSNASIEKGPLSSGSSDVVASMESGVGSTEIDRKLLWKIDIRLVPWLSFLYLLSFLDRTSIGNAKLYGLEKSLKITDIQYNTALSVFFVSYACFEVPSNIFLKRLRPGIWISASLTIWGVIMTTQGLVHSYSGLLASRFFLGLAEAGLFPGAMYIMSCWYKRSEFALRTAIFFAAATISGAFGGLIGARIGSHFNHVGGHPAWSWIFIIEGLVTVAAGLASFFIITDFPDNAKFLTDDERAAVVRRLQADNQFSAAGEGLRMKTIVEAIATPRTYVSMLLYAGCTMPIYAFSLFMPTIIAELGYTATTANLMTVPVYAVACTTTVIGAWISDRLQKRGFFNMVCLTLAIAAYIILLLSKSPKLSYFATFLASASIYPTIPNCIAWMGGNVEGSYKRAVVMAMFIGFGNLNGVVSSNVYMAKDKPFFRPGHGASMAYVCVGLLGTIIYQHMLRRENAARERGERDEVIGSGKAENAAGLTIEERIARNGQFSSVEEARTVKGDRWSGFRYTL